ncbi:MAG TPA: hypothetical protein VF532_21530, partial [Candidatus Angelobacter sp.]
VFALSFTPAAVHALQNRSQREMEKEMQDRQYKDLNKKRQQEIHDDTEKLFQLATELKAAVDKSNENLLSLEVVRKADEVEKLAKKVKEKMKEAVAPPPHVEPVNPPRMNLRRPPR